MPGRTRTIQTGPGSVMRWTETESVQTGGLSRVVGSGVELDCLLYRPVSWVRAGRILVSVHGISRNAEEHIALFSDLADRYGVMVVAPLFDAATFRDYQRLGRKGAGPRADLALIRLLNQVAVLTASDTGKVDMFGFSGGAQFVHRFALAHPQRVRSIGLGAAGWYTMPDNARSYPYGTADAKGLHGVRLNVAAASRVPTLVMVGECDDSEDDEELNRSVAIGSSQGGHRLARARAWSAAMNTFARRRGFQQQVRLAVLPGVAHSFSQAVLEGGLADQLFEHLYGRAGVCEQWQAGYHETTAIESGGQDTRATTGRMA